MIDYDLLGYCVKCHEKIADFEHDGRFSKWHDSRKIVYFILSNYSKIQTNMCKSCSITLSEKDYEDIFKSIVKGWEEELLGNCVGPFETKQYLNGYKNVKILGIYDETNLVPIGGGASITLPNTFSAGTTIQSAQVNSNFTTIYNDYNTNITNVNIASGANIASSKLDLSAIAQTVVYSSVAENWAKGSNLASAATVNIGAATGNFVDITGTTTITAFDTIQAGTFRIVRFTGALTLTHNATSLILPGSANITTANGDCAGFESLGSGNWKCVWYQKQDGTAVVGTTASTALSGSVIQTVNTNYTTSTTGTTVIPDDDTIPQNTEGDEYFTRAITPNNTSNLLDITVIVHLANSGSTRQAVALFQDSTAGALNASQSEITAANIMQTLVLRHYMTAGTTSSTTFKVRCGGAAGTTTINGKNGARVFGGVLTSSINIKEIKA